MIKLIRTLAPENGMCFDNVCSFETNNYIGIWNHSEQKFALVAKSDVEFHLVHLPYSRTLDKLDEEVYDKCGEHIIGVSENNSYTIIMEEEK